MHRYISNEYIFPDDIHNGIYLSRGAPTFHQLRVTSRRIALLDVPLVPLEAFSGRGRGARGRPERRRKKEVELL